MDSLLEQRRLDEIAKKEFECKRIIVHLEYIQKKEQELKDYLTDYISGDTTSEQLYYFSRDHASFVAYAPVQDPQVAIAVLIVPGIGGSVG